MEVGTKEKPDMDYETNSDLDDNVDMLRDELI